MATSDVGWLYNPTSLDVALDSLSNTRLLHKPRKTQALTRGDPNARDCLVR